ncbi:hypothetical protein GCM10027408_34950 [Microbacterium tumbae]
MVSIFEDREDLADPISQVESLYSEFGYPPSISGMVRYMPSPDGRTGTDAIYDRWSAFLSSEAEFLISRE